MTFNRKFDTYMFLAKSPLKFSLKSFTWQIKRSFCAEPALKVKSSKSRIKKERSGSDVKAKQRREEEQWRQKPFLEPGA